MPPGEFFVADKEQNARTRAAPANGALVAQTRAQYFHQVKSVVVRLGVQKAGAQDHRLGSRQGDL
jgi:hypothetical protein